MRLANRCPECGGVANHLLTDTRGERYYHCTTGLTKFRLPNELEGEAQSRKSNIIPCDTILHNGEKVTGMLVYISDGKMEALHLTNGKERR